LSESTEIKIGLSKLAIEGITFNPAFVEALMFCAYCEEIIKGNAFVYDDEEYCSEECLLAAHEDIEGELDKYAEDWEEEIEEYS
jgi:uncharacterized protein YbbC (DUF1343 family)